MNCKQQTLKECLTPRSKIIHNEILISTNELLMGKNSNSIKKTRNNKLKVLVVGAGAIGSLFAGKLSSSGVDVTILARGKRLESIDSYGLLLRESTSSLVEKFPIKVIQSLTPDDRYDFVLVTVQRTQVDALLPILKKNQSSSFVFMVNTASGYDSYIKAVGANRVMLAFPSAGGEVIDQVVVYRMGRGLVRLFQTTTVGELIPSSDNRVKRLMKIFRQSGIPTVACRSMDAWQKTHVAVVCAIAQALYKHGGNPLELSRHPADVRLMVAAMQEGFIILRFLGFPIVPKKLWYLRLPRVIVAIVFSLVLRTELAETAMAKHARRATEEMGILKQELLALVNESGMEAPAIRTLTSIEPHSKT